MAMSAVELAFLVNHFFHCLDHQRYDAAAALFCEDGVYATPRGELVGRAAILAALQARPQEHTTRHVITTFAAEVANDGEAAGLAYLLMFRATIPAKAGVAPLPPLEAVGDLECAFRGVSGGWRISRMAVRPVLAG